MKINVKHNPCSVKGCTRLATTYTISAAGPGEEFCSVHADELKKREPHTAIFQYPKIMRCDRCKRLFHHDTAWINCTECGDDLCPDCAKGHDDDVCVKCREAKP